MKNKLTDLKNHLFAQMERLADEGLPADTIESEHTPGQDLAYCQEADCWIDA